MRGLQEHPESEGEIDAETEYDIQRDRTRARGPWWLSCITVFGCLVIVAIAIGVSFSMERFSQYMYESGIGQVIATLIAIIMISVVAGKVILYIMERMDD